MFRSTWAPLVFIACVILGLAGCSAPCERYCETSADYIEYCLENGSQGEWAAASWSVWGSFSSKDDYISDCKADMESQLAGAATTCRSDDDALPCTCEDEANIFADLTGRGLCAELP